MKKKNPDNELVTKSFLNQKLIKFRDKILNAVDAVMKEVLAMREEQTVHFHQHEQINEKLDNHEARIKGLESHKFV